MLAFDRIYSWMFKSFRISSETDLISGLQSTWLRQVIVVKRSWIYALLLWWIPTVVLIAGTGNIYLAGTYFQKDPVYMYTILCGVCISLVLFLWSALSYVRHFRQIHAYVGIESDIPALLKKLEQWDTYFRRFFNQTITNQILILGLVVFIVVHILYMSPKGQNLLDIELIDIGLLSIQWIFLRLYRKRMMDIEMDYNIVVPGKIYFVNQSGLLSSMQTIDGDKIKSIQSKYPSKIASFFDYGNIDVLTEGDSASIMWQMSMYYVVSPDDTVASMQVLLSSKNIPTTTPVSTPNINTPIATKPIPEISLTPTGQVRVGTREHTYDTREKIRDVLR